MISVLHARAELRGQIAAPADAAFALLNDWAGILRWWPEHPPTRILHVELEGEDGALPRTRRITLAEGPVGYETLLKSDPVARRIYYDLRDGGIPIIRNYLATTTIDPVGEQACVMSFSSDFDVLAEQDIEPARAIILAVYGAIRDGFQAFFERARGA